MKKFTVKVMALIMGVLMVLSFASCGNGKFSTIDEYVKSDAVQSQLESIDMTGTGMTMDVYGEDNKLVYEYTYDEELDADVAAGLLESQLESSSATFENVAKSLSEAVNVDNPVVVVKYLNPDGSEIYSKEFSAK